MTDPTDIAESAPPFLTFEPTVPYDVVLPLSCAGCGCGISYGMAHWCAPAWARTTSAPPLAVSSTTITTDWFGRVPTSGSRDGSDG